MREQSPFPSLIVSYQLAAQLKAAGLTWQPQLHDFFTIPDTGFEDRAFVLGDMMATRVILKGMPAITFNGVVEWALDHVYQSEALWLPTETQLRERLVEQTEAAVVLRGSAADYCCEITLAGELLQFSADRASDAYACALLAVLQSK